MASRIGPRQASKKGNERFGAEDFEEGHRPPDVAPEDAGRDVSDEEAGIAGIVRKADDESRPPLADKSHDEQKEWGYITPPET